MIRSNQRTSKFRISNTRDSDIMAGPIELPRVATRTLKVYVADGTVSTDAESVLIEQVETYSF